MSSHISKERLIRIHNFLNQNGKLATLEEFNFSPQTLQHYENLYSKLEKDYMIHKKDGKKFPKILLLDVETLPMIVRVWGLYKQRIPIDNVVKDWILLSWAAKWLDEPVMMSDCVTSEEAIKRDDIRICKSIWNLIDQSDVIIGHNLRRFDIRKLNSRFIQHGFLPPSFYQTIDTLTESEKAFAHASHKLDWIGKLIRNEGKLHTDYQLWIDCEAGKQEALDEMSIYNQQDVVILEEAYLWMRPWIRSHPNLGLYMDLEKPVCSNCGSENLHDEGYYYTAAGKYAAIRCTDCGAPGRIRECSLSTKQKKTLIRPLAR